MAESAACVDPFLIKNWIRLILHFVERAVRMPIPYSYNPDNCWTGFSWLDVDQVFELLGFTEQFELSSGMRQTKDWFIARICKNVSSDLPGIWSKMARQISIEQSTKLLEGLGVVSIEELLHPQNPDLIYSNEYKG